MPACPWVAQEQGRNFDGYVQMSTGTNSQQNKT